MIRLAALFAALLASSAASADPEWSDDWERVFYPQSRVERQYAVNIFTAPGGVTPVTELWKMDFNLTGCADSGGVYTCSNGGGTTNPNCASGTSNCPLEGVYSMGLFANGDNWGAQNVVSIATTGYVDFLFNIPTADTTYNNVICTAINGDEREFCVQVKGGTEGILMDCEGGGTEDTTLGGTLVGTTKLVGRIHFTVTGKLATLYVDAFGSQPGIGAWAQSSCDSSGDSSTMWGVTGRPFGSNLDTIVDAVAICDGTPTPGIPCGFDYSAL